MHVHVKEDKNSSQKFKLGQELKQKHMQVCKLFPKWNVNIMLTYNNNSL